MATTYKGYDLEGEKLDNLEVKSLIGHGGMGEVYEAWDPDLDRKVAVKVLHPSMSGDDDFVKRFKLEAKAAAGLDHPGIVSIYKVGEKDDLHYIAMQFVEGATLQEVMKTSKLKPLEALEIAKDVAEALDHAHKRGMIHRDVKPENIMIDSEGRVRIMDFGLARKIADEVTRITQEGLYMGTPSYSSPEQCEGQEVGPESDIYSLGVVLYEMLTGTVPFSAKTPVALFRKITSEPPRPIKELNPNLSPSVIQLVNKAIEKDREKRFLSGEEFADNLSETISSDSRLAKAETVVTPLEDIGSRVSTIVATKKQKNSEKAAEKAPGKSSKNTGRAVAAGIASVIVLAAIVFFALQNGLPGRSDHSNGRNTAGPEQSRNVKPETTLAEEWMEKKCFKLAVLDFNNLTGAESLDWMRCGIPDMLITDLMQNRNLEVISREELARTAGERNITNKDDNSARNEVLASLGTDLALEGDLVKAGDLVRVDCRLVDQHSGKNILAEKATGKEDDILAMVERISQCIRGGLGRHIAKVVSPEVVSNLKARNIPVSEIIFRLDQLAKDDSYPGRAAVSVKGFGHLSKEQKDQLRRLKKQMEKNRARMKPGEWAGREGGISGTGKGDGGGANPQGEKDHDANQKKPSAPRKRELVKKDTEPPLEDEYPLLKKTEKADHEPEAKKPAPSPAPRLERKTHEQNIAEQEAKNRKKNLALQNYYSALFTWEKAPRNRKNLLKIKKNLERALELTTRFPYAETFLKKVEQELEKTEK